MSWDSARLLLDARFKALPGYDETRVAWPNEIFTQPRTGIYYQINFIPATVDPEMGGTAHEKGIYQVSVWGPSQVGIGPVLQAADAVVALFDRKRLSNVQCGVPIPAPYISDPDYFHLPVSIPFQVL